MNEIDVFICISNRSKSESDPSHSAPLEGNCSSRGAIFLSLCKSMGEFSFLIINNKKTISLISLKRYSIKLYIRAHLSGEFGDRGFKALGGVAFSNIFILLM